MKNQIKSGAVISYFNLVLNMCINIFFTPFLIRSLGDAEYGVYRVIQSFAGPLAIMTLGMATLVTRNIVYYDTRRQQKEKENFLAMGIVISLAMAAVTLLVGAGMYAAADKMFQSSLTPAEVVTAKKLILFFVGNMALTVVNDFFAGMVRGHEKFAVANGIRTLRLVLRVITLVVILRLGFKSVAIVATDLALTALVLLFNVFYGMGRLGEKIKFHYWDKVMFKSSMLFSAAILLQTIINQVNQNLDSVILGVMTDSKTVALYSVGLVIYTTYNSVSSIIAGLFTPAATRLVANEASAEQLTDFVSRIGRYQLMLVGAVLSGFILFGKEFILHWLGEGYQPVYAVVLWLIIPTTIPLIQSAYQAILDAKMKRMSRSVILSVMAGLNVAISIVLIHYIGYIGAAIGTAISILLGHGLIMNIYLYKVIKLDVIKMFKDILRGLFPSILLSMALGCPLAKFLPNTLLMFVVKIILFLIIYGLSVYFFGMNGTEKEAVQQIAKKCGCKK
ncbi:MAG: oligosaccharide flippase family protein [Clostridia bacterium]|nr:oligosaccharide flippase family protein [Clostridia bacterium]